MRIDSTFESADFHYIASNGVKRAITTLEEEEFPQFYHLRSAGDGDDIAEKSEIVPISALPASLSAASAFAATPAIIPKPGHFVYTENRKGISFDKIFGPWTDGATRIVITDPYIGNYDLYKPRHPRVG